MGYFEVFIRHQYAGLENIVIFSKISDIFDFFDIFDIYIYRVGQKNPTIFKSI